MLRRERARHNMTEKNVRATKCVVFTNSMWFSQGSLNPESTDSFTESELLDGGLAVHRPDQEAHQDTSTRTKTPRRTHFLCDATCMNVEEIHLSVEDTENEEKYMCGLRILDSV